MLCVNRSGSSVGCPTRYCYGHLLYIILIRARCVSKLFKAPLVHYSRKVSGEKIWGHSRMSSATHWFCCRRVLLPLAVYLTFERPLGLHKKKRQYTDANRHYTYTNRHYTDTHKHYTNTNRHYTDTNRH